MVEYRLPVGPWGACREARLWTTAGSFSTRFARYPSDPGFSSFFPSWPPAHDRWLIAMKKAWRGGLPSASSRLPGLCGSRPAWIKATSHSGHVMFQADAKSAACGVPEKAGNPVPSERPSAPGQGSRVSQIEKSAEGTIDLSHLARITFGERRLQAEVLALFDRQADMLLARMQQVSPKAAAAYAHTIRGSARGVGAWKVAAAAEGLEVAARDADSARFAGALRRLTAVIGEARAAIRDLLAVR
jgi:hypothetical protein